MVLERPDTMSETEINFSCTKFCAIHSKTAAIVVLKPKSSHITTKKELPRVMS
jgi:hypothetical protein